MRTALLALLIGLCAATLAPGLAVASPQECGRITRQIEHYQDMVDRAEALDNEMWEEGMQAHVERLKVRRAAVCHDYDDSDEKAMEAFAQFVKLAAKAAVTYFTFGAF